MKNNNNRYDDEFKAGAAILQNLKISALFPFTSSITSLDLPVVLRRLLVSPS
jgi:hypothetical protein